MSYVPINNDTSNTDDDDFINVINELYETKLAKAGDTITGDLAVTGSFTPNGGTIFPTETVAATNADISAAESGKTFFLSHATEFVSTLPAPAAGLKYTFIVANAPETASYTIVTTGGTDLIHGAAVSSADAGGSVDSTAGTAADTITFVDGQALVGDRVELISDGTYWYAYGICSDEDAITFTQT